MSLRFILIGLTALAIPLSFVAAPYPNELLLQHVPTVIGVVLLVIAAKRYQPSDVALGCCLAFFGCISSELGGFIRTFLTMTCFKC